MPAMRTQQAVARAAVPAAIEPDEVYDEPVTRAVAMQRLLDSVAFEPPAVATEVEHLDDGSLAWQRRRELIRSSDQSIVITSHYVDADEYGKEFLQELITAAKRGVEVSLTLDYNVSHLSLWRAPRAK